MSFSFRIEFIALGNDNSERRKKTKCHHNRHCRCRLRRRRRRLQERRSESDENKYEKSFNFSFPNRIIFSARLFIVCVHTNTFPYYAFSLARVCVSPFTHRIVKCQIEVVREEEKTNDIRFFFACKGELIKIDLNAMRRVRGFVWNGKRSFAVAKIE